ncbi:hypothetical protein SEA_CRICKO_52 [Streptomyces phage CricKo]|jgi:hypothetical protein|nr:hypothetical protein SEA_RAINYDAI_50 [Streptomyces phage Rainydai]AWN06151.1 hypothetical protein SEA_SENDITCS_48 [Streptomyces phage SendItCS]QJD49935.1 hypothetical protein SEA_CRICKO_52 [Streptomyces phage CricKo]QNL30667.1 hypothetical protein SEA_THIQQUMS_52 [Streptomyces phage Thiqqums]WIC89386.1 hypothetical protein SEA_MIEK_49 [Streptomyces phage Miek]
MSGISKREMIKKAYPTKAWAAKVDKMPDSQVVAIFFSLRRKGKV